jgi:DNA gyrase subunit B
MPSEISSTAGPQSSEDYSGSSITVLRGLEAVRKRPGMYIGDTDDGSGLHHMVFEIVDNADRRGAGRHATRVDVVLNGDGSVTVTDDGRGIPVDIHEEEGVSAAEVVLTAARRRQVQPELLQGLRRPARRRRVGGERAVRVAGGAHLARRASSTSSASSTATRCSRCASSAPSDGRAENGTEVTFKPSARPSPRPSTSAGAPAARAGLPEQRACASRCATTATCAQEVDSRFEGGSRLRRVARQGQGANLQAADHPALKEGDGIRVELAMWWNDSPHEVMLCFTNNIPQRDGGTHLTGFRAAMTRVSTSTSRNELAKKAKVELTGDDMREGLTCVLSVKVPDPKFSSQTKDKLVSSEVRGPVVRTSSPR